MKSIAIALCIAVTTGGAALAQTRLPTIPPAQYTEEQKKAAAELEAARKQPVFGPFEPMMHSPRVMNLARAMGDYLRYDATVGPALSELAILVTAREWTQEYEWSVHVPGALKAGVKQEMIDAIAEGRRPAGMSDDEEMVYDFSIELHRYKGVSDRTYDRVQTRFGNKGVVDLIGVNAYYTFLAMQMNVARKQPAPGSPRIPKFPN